MAQKLILLHGALGSKDQLKPVQERLEERYTTYSFNFIGHGGEKIPDTVTMPMLVDQLHAFVQSNISSSDTLTIFGYSMGGYVALLLASKNICKIDRVVTLGTKLNWTPEIAETEIKMLDPVILAEKVPAFAKELQERHQPEDWKLLLSVTANLMRDLGTNQYLNDSTFGKIQTNCKLMLGDNDKMVTLDETLNGFRKIKGSALSVLPSTPHPIEKVDLTRLIFELQS